MLFSLHSRAYKPNSYPAISWSETKMHTYEKSAFQGETQEQLLKYILGREGWGTGRGELQTVLIYALTMQKGLLP